MITTPQARRLRAPEPQPANNGTDEVFGAIKSLFDRAFARISALEERRAAANGRDGVGISDVAIVSGHLHIYFTDGTTKDLGQVVGRDAEPAPPPQELRLERDADGRVVRGVLS